MAASSADNLEPFDTEFPPGLKQELEESLQKWESNNNKSLSILLTGKTGAGKSTLVNGILGGLKGCVENTAKASNVLSVGATTTVQPHCCDKNGVKVTVWDSPGLQDGTPPSCQDQYLKQMKDLCSDVDLVMYCLRITESRFIWGPDNIEFKAMQMLTATFGHVFWQKVVIVLTYANILEAVNPEWDDLSKEERHKAFNHKIKDWQDQIIKMLANMDISNEIFDVTNLRIVPAGRAKFIHLPGVEYWLSNLWLQCFLTIRSSDARCAFLQINEDRLVEKAENAETTQAETSSQPLEEQPIVISKRNLKNLIKGFGKAGGFLAMAGISGQVGSHTIRLFGPHIAAKMQVIGVKLGLQGTTLTMGMTGVGVTMVLLAVVGVHLLSSRGQEEADSAKQKKIQ